MKFSNWTNFMEDGDHSDTELKICMHILHKLWCELQNAGFKRSVHAIPDTPFPWASACLVYWHIHVLRMPWLNCCPETCLLSMWYILAVVFITQTKKFLEGYWLKQQYPHVVFSFPWQPLQSFFYVHGRVISYYKL